MDLRKKIDEIKSKLGSIVLKEYIESKKTLSSTDVLQIFYNMPGHENDLYFEIKEWFDTVVLPNQKRGLNTQGYMRLIAM